MHWEFRKQTSECWVEDTEGKGKGFWLNNSTPSCLLSMTNKAEINVRVQQQFTCAEMEGSSKAFLSPMKNRWRQYFILVFQGSLICLLKSHKYLARQYDLSGVRQSLEWNKWFEIAARGWSDFEDIILLLKSCFLSWKWIIMRFFPSKQCGCRRAQSYPTVQRWCSYANREWAIS